MSRILIIDDNELLGRMLKENLQEQGFEVDTALDANEGYASAIEKNPDLILLDVQLPDVQGFDLIRIIKNRDELKHTPIMMITGTHSQTDHKVKAFQAGADDYILKPFELSELVERMRAVLRRSENKSSYSTTTLLSSSPAVASRGTMDSAPETAGNDSLIETVFKVLSAPESLSLTRYPSVTMLYLSTLLGLALGGWALSSGSTMKPALIGLGTIGFWGLCVSFLVMACSIMGISLTWKDGARLMCLAGLPILLKLLGGLSTTLATSLSPFYFTASPALFFKKAPALLERLDIFEWWTIWLIWQLVKRCKGSTNGKASIAAAVVWPILAYWQSLWKH